MNLGSGIARGFSARSDCEFLVPFCHQNINVATTPSTSKATGIVEGTVMPDLNIVEPRLWVL